MRSAQVPSTRPVPSRPSLMVHAPPASLRNRHGQPSGERSDVGEPTTPGLASKVALSASGQVWKVELNSVRPAASPVTAGAAKLVPDMQDSPTALSAAPFAGRWGSSWAALSWRNVLDQPLTPHAPSADSELSTMNPSS